MQRNRLTLSLRGRFILVNLMLLLPLLILAFVGYLTYQRILMAFDEAMNESLAEMLPITRLEYTIVSAEIPLHSYLIHGNRDELRQFEQIVEEINTHFSDVRAIKSLQSNEEIILQGVEKEWRDNIKLAEKIMKFNPPFGADAIVMMKLFDLRMQKINQKLQIVRKSVRVEINNLYQSARERQRKSFVINMIIIVISSIIAVLVGWYLGRTIVKPIQSLQHAAGEFAQGNMDHRVTVSGEDELSQLASTFNNMVEKIESLVIHDPLTNLLNKREFETRLAHEILRAQRYTHPVSLCMIDIDHFKAVNDEHGHPVGDSVLCHVSSLIKQQVRRVDHVARYGGEEIVVILPQVNQHDALLKAEAIRESIQDEIFSYSDTGKLRITVSIGVATFEAEAQHTPESLVSAADKALYVAKRGGRNRVESY